jgi:hypothetical protein
MMWTLVFVVVVVLLLSHIGAAPRITLTVEADALHVQQGGWDSIYCLRHSLDLPLDEIEGVAAAPRELVPATGLRLPGIGVPGVIRAGSFGMGLRRDFWNVRRGQMLLVIQLRPGAAYRRVVLEVADPQAEALRLRPAVGAYAGDFGG